MRIGPSLSHCLFVSLSSLFLFSPLRPSAFSAFKLPQFLGTRHGYSST